MKGFENLENFELILKENVVEFSFDKMVELFENIINITYLKIDFR